MFTVDNDVPTLLNVNKCRCVDVKMLCRCWRGRRLEKTFLSYHVITKQRQSEKGIFWPLLAPRRFYCSYSGIRTCMKLVINHSDNDNIGAVLPQSVGNWDEKRAVLGSSPTNGGCSGGRGRCLNTIRALPKVLSKALKHKCSYRAVSWTRDPDRDKVVRKWDVTWSRQKNIVAMFSQCWWGLSLPLSKGDDVKLKEGRHFCRNSLKTLVFIICF